jgi:hypothetical protein
MMLPALQPADVDAAAILQWQQERFAPQHVKAHASLDWSAVLHGLHQLEIRQAEVEIQKFAQPIS